MLSIIAELSSATLSPLTVIVGASMVTTIVVVVFVRVAVLVAASHLMPSLVTPNAFARNLTGSIVLLLRFMGAASRVCATPLI